MAAGDASKTWFPEVVSQLEKGWFESITWEEMISLCHKLTKVRDEFRDKLNIKGPKAKCPDCGEIHVMGLSPISIRGALFALIKFGFLSEEKFEGIEKSWLKFQRKNKLNAIGV